MHSNHWGLCCLIRCTFQCGTSPQSHRRCACWIDELANTKEESSWLKHTALFCHASTFRLWPPWAFGCVPSLLLVLTLTEVNSAPSHTPSPPITHKIKSTAMTHHSNNSIRDHMKWVSASLFMCRIQTVSSCVLRQRPVIFVFYFSHSSPLSQSLQGVPQPALMLLFVSLGWLAGLRGGAVQHGPDASQQHSRSKENDVIHGSRAPGNFWGSPKPLAPQPQPQPPRTPKSPRASQRGPHVDRELSTTGEWSHSPVIWFHLNVLK